MLERPKSTDAVILVSIDFNEPDYEESLYELRQLVTTAGLSVTGTVEGKRNVPDAKLLLALVKLTILRRCLKPVKLSLLLSTMI